LGCREALQSLLGVQSDSGRESEASNIESISVSTRNPVLRVLGSVTARGIIVSLVPASLPACVRRLGFIASPQWNPVTEQFGALVPIVGTLVTSFIALLIGVPVSFGIALFLTELSPTWMRRPLGTAIELLAAIPSIIYGMWGLFVFAPPRPAPALAHGHSRAIPIRGMLFQGPPMGIGVLTAGSSSRSW